MKLGLTVFLFAFGMSAAVAAAPQAKLGMKNPDAPIEVSADNLSADMNSKMAVYSGHVIIHQGEVRMRADTVRISSVDGKADKVIAVGAVVVDAPSGTATGDSGVYDVNPRIITLTGHVVLTKEKNVMRGSLLTVNLVTGLAKLGGGQGETGQHTRVQGLFTPKSQSDENP